MVVYLPMSRTVSFGDNYVRRLVDDELDQVFPMLPAVLLDGPKGVGKTATALQRSRTTRRLDNAADRAVIEADPLVIGSDAPPVLIDEWHRVPPVLDAVRQLVDRDLTGGRFLLTGSPPAAQTHSGAGRISTVRMRPLSLYERGVGLPTVSFTELLSGARPKVRGTSPLGLVDYVDEIIAGGFPGMRHLTGRALNLQLDSYLDRIVDHDLRQAGYTVRRPAALYAWMRAYAAATSTTASWEKVRDAATAGVSNKPAKSTVENYTDLLTMLRILDPIDAWLPSMNHLSRLNQGPKHQMADPALAVRLLGRTRRHLLEGVEGAIQVLRDGTLLGNLFESLAALSVRTFAQACESRTYHLRTMGGRQEIPFIVEGPEGVLAFEVKLSSSIGDRDVQHLHWLKGQLGNDLLDAVVLHTGPEAYRRRDGIAVIPLELLGP